MAIEKLAVAHAVTPEGVVDDAVITISDGRIVSVEQGGGEGRLWAVPGFVDTHCHGAVGVSFGNPDRAANLRAIEYHRTQGATTLIASTVTEPVEKLEAHEEVLRGLYDDGEIAGIHLEGPFLAEEKKGAHDPALLIDPEPELVDRLIAAGGPALRMVTMAPERAHSEEAVRRFVDAGVHVAFGHSDADDATTAVAIGWGADIATHLFSAMRSIHHREPGPVPVLLHDSRVGVELVCDGVHLAPDVVQLALDAAGAHRVLLVTDAMSATGCPDGDYQLGSLPVRVERGTARLVRADGEPGAIAGSTLTMDRAVAFVVGLGCSLAQASLMASRSG